jgi:glutamate carboxypeptidase
VHPFLRYATEKQAEIVSLIGRLINCESPSDAPREVDRMVDLLIAEMSGIAAAETFPGESFGRHLLLRFRLPGAGKSGQVLALGHSDTVWPMGTLRSMQFREADGRLWGPGVLDMKAGLAFFVFAMRALIELEVKVPHEMVLLVVSDEEVGSPSSRAVTEAEALRSRAVLVLEPGTGLSGKLKTARKGVGNYRISIEGRAAHAGVSFEDGASAIIEAAHQILQVAAWTDQARGTTVNPGVIQGGSRTNVVAAEAQIDCDVRVTRLIDAEALDHKFRSLAAQNPRCRLRITGGLNRPPMERTAAIGSLFDQAKLLALGLGVEIEESATGGGSDGNLTAALGVPTLDGLGAVGEGAHASNESILTDRIADRVALLTSLAAADL